ncbi:CbiX/SirB N-terminal domain-containing protein [Novispirillum sp. DQ9]|uniref:CbiX/SirB N-terminal domain-containing protein n=1 Tax=Novispirillum sp. DQ9 TaxID=3398612 RepID=UPI003C7BD7CF
MSHPTAEQARRLPADAASTPNTALLLVGHGSSRAPQARDATDRLAEAVRKSGRFAEVRTAFLKQSPSIAEALATVTAPAVTVVPNFAAEGYFTRSVIPAALAEAGFAGSLRQTRAVGAHPRMEDIIRRRAVEALRRSGAATDAVALLLIGHGSSRPGGASAAALALAERLRKGCGCAGVHACFLEEAPFVADWPALTPAPVVIALPLLVAEGLHGSQDLPPLFGLHPAAVTAPDAPPLLGPLHAHGRTVWYWRGIGSDPDVVSVILSIADEDAAVSATPAPTAPAPTAPLGR